ncbi:TPA_asm: Golgi anti-apoptotic protein [Vaccinia virus]|nr:TPA_asm: Golgi anti-apoptotic protein [Vaccinia virus]
MVLSAFGALVFCGFIIYDMHSLIHKLSPEEYVLVIHKLSPEEYVLASINLYLDIINMFLHLLQLLEVSNKK